MESLETQTAHGLKELGLVLGGHLFPPETNTESDACVFTARLSNNCVLGILINSHSIMNSVLTAAPHDRYCAHFSSVKIHMQEGRMALIMFTSSSKCFSIVTQLIHFLQDKIYFCMLGQP